MKKLLANITIVATIVATAAIPFATNAATTWDATGNYVIAFDYLGTPYSHDMNLVQNGTGGLSGNGGNPVGANVYMWTITSGAVTGNSIDFLANYTATSDAVTPQTTMHVVGTIAANGSISGTWTDNYQGGSRSGTFVTTSGAAQSVTNTTVIVSGNTSAGENQPGWLFNRDLTTATPYTFNYDTYSIASGSLYVLPIGANASDKFVGENFLNALIANVDSISYDFKIGSTTPDTQEEQFYMNVYANFGVSPDDKFYDCRYNVVPTIGSTTGFTTVTFDPTQSYPVTTRGGATPSPFACPSVPANMDLLSAGSNIRAFALNVGDTSVSDLGVSGYLDNVVVRMGTNMTTYNFDPTPVVVTPTAPTNKDQCKNDGWKTFTNPTFKNQGQCVSYAARI